MWAFQGSVGQVLAEFKQEFDVCVFPITQELYEKSLVRVVDGSLPADLLEIKTFRTAPQVISVSTQIYHANLSSNSSVT